MSADAVLWIVMAFCLIVGCPIFVSLGVASTLALILTNIPMRIVALDMLKVMDMFPLLAVVGFIFAGALMEKGGMARQIVDVASLFVGRIRGGLGITTILGCLFFAAMIGSGPGTVAAMGSIMIPTMVRRGYSPEYAAGVCATGGTLGILIPPSNPMIIYGIIANTSIAALFTAGFVPGFVLGLMMMLMAYFLARRAGFTGTVDEDKGAHFWPMFRKNFFSLMAPVIILGSIYAGICTPVEASVVAVFYALFVGTCITRELKISLFARRAGFTGTVMLMFQEFLLLMAPVIILGSIYADRRRWRPGCSTPCSSGRASPVSWKIIQLWDAIKLTNVSRAASSSCMFKYPDKIPHFRHSPIRTSFWCSSGFCCCSSGCSWKPRHHRHPRACFPAPGRHRSRVLAGICITNEVAGGTCSLPKPVGHQLERW